MDFASKELSELLRKCLVLGGPLAQEAAKVIEQDFPFQAINFIYPHIIGGDEWVKEYRK